MSRLVILVGLVMALALALPDTTEAASFNEVKKLTASDGHAGRWFGNSVALSGDTAVVGAPDEDGSRRHIAGAAYVFQRDEGGADNWGEVKKLTASDAEASDRFGFSVALSGDIAVVGAPFENVGVGRAYVFQRDEGGADNWGEVKKLTASDAQTDDVFGFSVAVSGGTAVVGSGAGAAYVFQRDEGGADNWGEDKKLTASDAPGGIAFGIGVALSGDTAVVGAYLDDAGAGAAYIFRRNEGGAGNWGEVTKFIASDAEAGDLFGRSVAMSGDTTVVGAEREDAGGNEAGAAYVFGRDQGGADNWGEVTKLTASDAEAFAFFGTSVEVSGDTAVVGAPGGPFLFEQHPGAAYVFQRNEGGAENWGEVKKPTASDVQAHGRYGISVAVSGDTAVVGANEEDSAGSGGAAYVFQALFQAPTPGPVGGIALDSDLRALPLETANSGRSPWGIAAAIAAAAGLVAVGGAAWYARRRRA